MTTPKVITTSEGQISVPKLTVQQIIDLSATIHESNRSKLMRDLDDSGAPHESRLEALAHFRKEEGLTSVIIRSAFSLEGAMKILAEAFGGEVPNSITELDPTEITNLALSCFGIDVIGEKGESEGK